MQYVTYSSTYLVNFKVRLENRLIEGDRMLFRQLDDSESILLSLWTILLGDKL